MIACNKLKKYVVGIDVGGTKIKAILFDGKKIIVSAKIFTPKKNKKDFFIAVGSLVNLLIEKEKITKENIKSVGIGIPGVLDTHKKIILDAPNIKILNGVSIVKELENILKIPVSVDNDASCFLRAERRFGKLKGFLNIYAIIIGTGIGGSYFSQKFLNKKEITILEEPGRIFIDLKTKISLEEKYHKLIKNNPTHFIDSVLQGKKEAKKKFKEIGTDLGKILGKIMNIFNPEVIVIGGGVSKFDNFFLPDLKKQLAQEIKFLNLKNKVKLVKSSLGEYSGAVGAALLYE